MNRPRKSAGGGVLVRTGCGTLNVMYREYEGRIQEVFALQGKCGGCVGSQTEAIGRLVSLLLRNNVDIAEIIKQLKGIRCASQHLESTSCADAIAKVLQELEEELVHATCCNTNCCEGNGCVCESTSKIDTPGTHCAGETP